MCGLVGFWDVARDTGAEVLRRMSEVVSYRGPDDAAQVLIDSASGDCHLETLRGPAGERTEVPAADVGLGSRRLAILDPAPGGRMPMASPCRRFWIVHNGEVYNYREVRAELEALGHAFSTGTDSEVVLAAYREWGEECLGRFNGMFAFAVWDGERRRLFGARDRLGIKPLYYVSTSGLFLFASEIKQLLLHPRTPRRVNEAAVYDYLALGLVDHGDETFFAGIHPLPAAHCFRFEPEGGLTLRRWWEPPEPEERRLGSAAEERALVEEFGALLDDAVRLRLRTDVPLGTCLSGGLDSSSIAILANRHLLAGEVPRELVGEHQKTFSACFDDARFDERPFIRLVLEATGAESYAVFPSREGLWRELDELLWTMDQPFQSTSQFSQRQVFRRAREAGVKVTLDGQGADELLGGYPAYAGVLLGGLVRAGRLGEAVREARATAALGGRARSSGQLLARVAYGLLPGACRGLARRAASLVWGAAADGTRAPLARAFARRHAGRRRAWQADRERASTSLVRRLHADVFRFSLPALLRYADRNSMASSVESRTPFLDYRLVEKALALPARLRFRDGWSKWALREAMGERLPEEIRWRRDKMGFVTPEVIWLSESRAEIERLLAGDWLSGDYLSRERVVEGIERTLERAPRSLFYTEAFRWICLELWMRRFLGSGEAPSSDPPAA